MADSVELSSFLVLFTFQVSVLLDQDVNLLQGFLHGARMSTGDISVHYRATSGHLQIEKKKEVYI